jgi:5-deoxy-glucuronate isomerase
MNHHLKSKQDATVRLDVTPATAGWRYLSFQVIALEPGETFSLETAGSEVALTTLSGNADVQVSGQPFTLARRSVFTELAQVLYVPPGKAVTISATTRFECAIGGAPAEGKYPTRLVLSHEMKRELRGGSGAAQRQVNHLLAYPLPAERLILYDAYLPGGMWGGIPPHCHDGYMNSPYLEETYYYCITPADGFAFHRNYRCDTDFDEVFTVRNGDLILVTQGFHPVAAAPGSNVYFLNYLAGDLLDEARSTPPYDDPTYAWLKQNWGGNAWQLPMFETPQ